MPAAYLASLDEHLRGDAWEDRVVAERAAGDDLDHVTLIAEITGAHPPEIVGVATVGPYRDDPTAERGELWMINVLPTAWGIGVGRQLLSAASDRLVELGFEAAMLWVVKGNARARRFYEREGWTPDGTEKRHRFGDQLVPELRYGATLAGALSG
jgi:GNAT superfamily N-acetyltransferase